ncbi:MAG TPA: hypothetical protein PKX11_05555 [Methanospirillum sp.]|jgi:uncharacterized membrane protein HdeD (DUF308 family)|uniref:hypothetical protein n=1 Tax=Methanospirillum sp. TaxID=45200 RepID=UPI0026361B0D|nr:hypothetical protein [Methanospirillum sp.]HQC00001.1 hypothetical protein [Methanospirillum sp.]
MMGTSNKSIEKRQPVLSGESDLTLEVVILIIFGIFMLLFGIFLFQIHTGALPYAPDSTYGLFLLLVAIQMITMGKTPFGDLQRSWFLILIGICVAIVGMAASFIPGYLSFQVKEIVGFILLAGGAALLLQLFVREDKARTWKQYPGVIRQLILACGLVYAISCICGLITLAPGITTDYQTAVILILYSMSFFYIAFCIQRVKRQDPLTGQTDSGVQEEQVQQAEGFKKIFKEVTLSISVGVVLLVATLLTLLGILLIPVNLGLLPFSQDGLLGMLLVIFSIQMMALGETPLGPYKRSWFLIIIGIIFATLGISACIVPGLLTSLLQVLVGLLNIIGGVILLFMRFYPILQAKRNPPEQPAISHPLLLKMGITQTILNFVSIAFGISMLIPGIIPGIINANIIIVNGLLLFVLTSFILKAEVIARELQI